MWAYKTDYVTCLLVHDMWSLLIANSMFRLNILIQKKRIGYGINVIKPSLEKHVCTRYTENLDIRI